MATLTIELKEDESADEAVVNYVIERGLFTDVLRRMWGDPWRIDNNRIIDIANRIGPLIPHDHQLTIGYDTTYSLERK